MRVHLAEEQITDAIDLLRQHQVRIFAVEPQRETLESAFIDLISREDETVGATS